MDADMEEVINILRSMGATSVEFIERAGYDDELRFSFGGQSIVLSGRHYNDRTGGIGASVEVAS